MGNPGWKKDNRTLREQDEVGLSEAGSGCGRQARHSQLLATMGEVDGGGGQGGASGLLGSGEPDTAVDAERAAKRRVHPEGEEVCAPAGHPGEGRWRQQGVDCVPERVAHRRAAGECGEKIDEASRVTDETNWTMRPSEIGTACSAGVPVSSWKEKGRRFRRSRLTRRFRISIR